MTQPYECEVRFGIESIEEFEAKLAHLGARVALPYEFTDHYYRPITGLWNPTEKNIRIRQWFEPYKDPVIYFVKLEVISIGALQFKRALCPEGKLPLFTGSMDACRTLLEDIGFEFWFALRKEKARLWEIPQHQFFTAVEYIQGLGWTAELEFEGQDPQKANSAIQHALNVLDIPRHLVTYRPLAAIYLEDGRKGRKNEPVPD